MKRPPGLWILLSAGVLWLSLQNVYGIRATALIFGKSATSTTTEASPSTSPEENVNEKTGNSTESSSTSNSTEKVNSTSPVLTGIPQIDYIWDPNLPKELNGYNLSEYPFYERVPDEEIEFKCDGLHDGFYASVPHKCQVYHHCLFGTRYDFLCANYTAFDQKTFICHFVSEVDCVNSKKFWHRNDALYQAASTTTVAPVNLRAAIYTTAPPDGGDPITPIQPRRPAGGGARRPYRPNRRRRPHFEYYDDEYYDEEYYDEIPRANRGRKRPRPRPRPAYEDEYEEFNEDRYESRRASGRRRPHRRRNKDRKKEEYDEEEEVDDRFEDEDFITAQKRQKTDDRRKPPLDEDDDADEDRSRKRPSEKRRPSSDKRVQNSDLERKPPRKGSNKRRPSENDYEDELPESDDSRDYEQRPRNKHKGYQEETTNSDARPIIKPSTGTIYDRPRVAPRINLPVPKNAADKYSYKALGGQTTTKTTSTTASPVDEQYEDEEYEEPSPKRPSKQDRRKPSEEKREREKFDTPKMHSTPSRPRTRKPDNEEIVEKIPVKAKYGKGNRYTTTTTSSPSKVAPVSEEYDDEEYLEEEEPDQGRRSSLKNENKYSSINTRTTTTSTTTTTTTTAEPPRKEKHEPLMRVIKRPFLPSRGGSPYSPRGLQPIGLKAVDKVIAENESAETINGSNRDRSEDEDTEYLENKETSRVEAGTQNNRQPAFKPSPILMKVPVDSGYNHPSAEAQMVINSEHSRQKTYKTEDLVGIRATQKPKFIARDPLDINEYDVTLNDALNPTLPNVPVRTFPTGFSSPIDYNYNSYTRPRYVVDPVLSPSNQNFGYANNKVVRSQQRYEGHPQGHHSAINGGGYRQQHPQVQTQAIYSSY